MELGIKDGESNEMNKFLTEILEQPESLNSTLDYYAGGTGEKILRSVRDLFQKGKLQEIIFTGMGSSYFASYAASCLFNNLGIRSIAMETSELLYYNFSIINEKTLLMLASQSGESVEVVKLLEKIPEDVSCIGISNEEKTSLSGRVRELLLSKAGREEMTSTKTYTAMILVMSILGWYLAGLWGKEKIQQVKKLVNDTEKLLASYKDSIVEELNFLGDTEFMQFIGRGPSYATALQSELMFKEAAREAASGTLGGEFRHGPMEMVNHGFKSILFTAEGKTYRQSVKMAADIAKYKGKVVMITNCDPHIVDSNIRTITINQPDEYLFAIQNVIPVQLMVNHLALAKGLVPGDFVNGGKVTLSE